MRTHRIHWIAWVLALAVSAGCSRVQRISVGPEPGSLALDARGRTLFVACEGGPSVVAWDLEKNAAAAEVRVGAGPIRLQMDRERNELYVLCRGARRLTVFHVPDLQPVKTLLLPDGPAAWTCDPERGLDLFCIPEANLVRPFVDKNILPAVETGAEPVDLLLQPGTDKLWVAGYRGRELAVVSLQKSQVIKRIAVHPNPLRLQFAPAENRLFVLCAGRDAVPAASVVQEVDINYQVAGLTHAVGRGARDFVIGPLGRRFYCVTSAGLNLTTLTNGVSRTLKTGRDPQAVVIAPDESKAYVSCRREQAVYVHRIGK